MGSYFPGKTNSRPIISYAQLTIPDQLKPLAWTQKTTKQQQQTTLICVHLSMCQMLSVKASTTLINQNMQAYVTISESLMTPVNYKGTMKAKESCLNFGSLPDVQGKPSVF